MKRAIVVGSGAGGATVAKELQGRFDVTVLEAGGAFRPLALTLRAIERIKRAGLLFDERELSLVFPSIQVRKTSEMVLVNGIGLGGTTTICTGNALRMDQGLRSLGIDLDPEFGEIYQEIPVTTAHQKRWRKHTRRLFEICSEMGLDPQPTPKMGAYDRCVGCGRCVFGCTRGAKWDSRQFLQAAVDRGARVIPRCRVQRVVIEDGRALGVEARVGWTRQFYPADLVILAAGGFGTPAILNNSGIPCEPHLFVDPVLCVATRCEDVQQYKEIEMPFVVQRTHYILSPYFDYLSYPFNRTWNYPARDILGMMIKLADAPSGSVTGRKVTKPLAAEDKQTLSEGVELCREILCQFTGREDGILLGTINAGHPGGTLPLTAEEAASFHHRRLPGNVYVADASLFPQSLGNPPILTIIAMAKRVSRMCAQMEAKELI
jgi:choline dehydrogenase-like flavoprotein